MYFSCQVQSRQFLVTAVLVLVLTYRNGRWRSVWSLHWSAGDATAALTGKYELDVHYYEDGNVQLKAKHESTKDVDIKDPAATAKAIIAIISKAEGAYQVCTILLMYIMIS